MVNSFETVCIRKGLLITLNKFQTKVLDNI